MKHLIPLCFAFLCASSLTAQNWSPLNGPIGVNIIHSIFTHKDELFAITTTDEVFLSKDKGISWTNISVGIISITNHSSTFTKFQESYDGKMYLCHRGFFYILNSTNNSWTLQNDNVYFEDFTVGPKGTIYAGDDRLFYISNDDGKTFTHKASWNLYSDVLFECKGNGNNFVCGAFTGDKLYSFNDDGSNLRFIGYTPSNITHEGYRYLLYDTLSGNMFAAGYKEAYISLDKGIKWNKIIFPDSSGFFHETGLLQMPNGNLLAIGFDNNFVSSDGGLSWKEDYIYKPDYPEFDYASFSNDMTWHFGYSKTFYNIAPNNAPVELFIPINKPSIQQLICFGPSGILCKTNMESKYHFSGDDGQTWNQTINFIHHTYPLIENIDAEGNIYSVTIDSIYSYNLYNGSVTSKPLPTPFFYGTSLVSKSNELILFDPSNVYISNDKGTSWQHFPFNYSNNFSDPLKCSANNIIYTSDSYFIYYSNNDGVDWLKFPASGIVSTFDNLYLSKTNVFYWEAISPQTNRVCLYSTSDFGQTTQIEDSSDVIDLIYIDDNNTKFYQKDSGIIIRRLNSSKDELLTFDGLDLKKNEGASFTFGQNGYIYCSVYNRVLYKSTKRISDAAYLVSGKIILDDNQNCLYDASDSFNQHWTLKIDNGFNSLNVQTNFLGEYLVSLSEGNYTLTLIPKSVIWEACNPIINFKVDSTPITIPDFLVKPIEFCPDLSTDITLSRLRRCSDNGAVVKICNHGTEDASNTRIHILLDSYFESIQSYPDALTKNGQDWYYEFPQIRRDNCVEIHFDFRISCNASRGQEHCMNAFVENDKNCNLLSSFNDTTIICQRNIASFDPNDKTAFVNSKEESSKVKPNEEITYLIRFQNTGTDTAFNVKIKDQLSNYLDLSSFEVISSSNEYSYTLNSFGSLEINFSNIMLPDSNINFTTSNGYFKYKIKQQKDLKPGANILNQASIYFDYNAPVLTNTIKLKVQTITKTNNSISKMYSLQITPNPFSEETRIKLPDDFIGQSCNWRIYDCSGTFIYQFTNSNYSQEVKLSGKSFNSGLYFVEVTTAKNLKAIGKMAVIH